MCYRYPNVRQSIQCVAMGLLVLFQVSAQSEIIRKIPVAEGLASHPVNGGHCLISDETHQYLAFYDGQHQLTVAKRKLGKTKWDFAKLPEKVGWDTHNRIVIFLDRDGCLHLTGNMHCAPLRYYRTQKPGDIHTFKAIHSWTGQYENRVTYPNLLQLKDGSSHIMYRHGGSGNGMRLLVHYDERSKTWTGTGQSFISGMDRDPTCNAYPFGIKEDASGTLHITWCWRETPDVETNFDICYAKSMDNGLTWQRWDGTKLDLPIHPGNADAADRIPQKKGLMNGGSLVIDKNGFPSIGYTCFDSDGYNQLFIATPVGKSWKVVQLTDWDKRFWFKGRGTIPEYPPIPRLTMVDGETIHVRYAWNRLTPRSGRIAFTRERLLTMKPGDYELLSVSKKTSPIPNRRATNIGPLPEGQVHYMQQEAARPNRDRKPANPKKPTMIYIVETK